MKRKHCDVIIAYANGATIQIKAGSNDNWYDMPDPCFDDTCVYRVKPEPKPDLVLYAATGWRASMLEHGTHATSGCYSKEAYVPNSFGEGFVTNGKIKLTFDGETGKLKSSEVIA